MKLPKKILWLVSVLFSCNVVASLNILGIFPYQGKSHFYVFQPYLQELARRGHNLTVISHFPQKPPLENYHDISLAGTVKAYEGTMPTIDRSYWALLQMFLFLFDMSKETCEIMLMNKEVQNMWLSKANFDVVVTEQFNSDCSLGIAHKLGVPVVGITSHVTAPWYYEPNGIVYNPSYMPHMMLEGGTKPTLSQRVERTVFYHLGNALFKYISQRTNQKQLQQYFEVPPLEELARDVKFVLVYSNFVLNTPNLLPPNVIEVGGYHVAKPKELPQELKKFIEDSKHGVIYISFGSMVQSTSLPEEKLNYILEAISELPQRVIWKWDATELPGNPNNVYLSKWLPQNDILAHPNVVAFYSHCGMLGTTEAIYHGVPMIGMPIFGDQPINAAAVEESGLGVQIQLSKLTKELLLHKMKTVLDPKFRNKVKELSRIWHDRPSSPMDSAIYWTEFAARTKNYTFSSPVSTVPLYQYYYLDIILVTVVVLLVIVIAIKKLLQANPNQKTKKIKVN